MTNYENLQKNFDLNCMNRDIDSIVLQEAILSLAIEIDLMKEVENEFLNSQ